MRASVDDLRRAEEAVEASITLMQQARGLPDKAARGSRSKRAKVDPAQWVSMDDIMTLPHYRGSTVFAVRAPSGTTLEVPGTQPQ